MSKFIKFCLVGVINTTISFVIFYTLSEIIGLNYLFSSFTGYVAGVVNSYIINKRWTFQDESKSTVLQFSKFILVNLFSLGVNLLVMYLAVEKLGLPKTVAQIMAIGFTTVVNFTGSRIIFYDNNKIPGLQKI